MCKFSSQNYKKGGFPERQEVLFYKKLKDQKNKNEPSFAGLIRQKWKIALDLGVVHFLPNKQNFREKKIGVFIKRIISDRASSSGREKMSGASIPVFIPFNCAKEKFNYFKIPKGQELFRIKKSKREYCVLASNSPLSYSPHTLLVPKEKRPQFIELCDIRIAHQILKENPSFIFLFSSMGGGAGVNHMHLHMIAGKEFFPVTRCSKRKVILGKSDIKIETLIDWPSNSFIFSGKRSLVMEVGYEFISYLQSKDMPHNILINQGELWINPRSRKTSKIMPSKKLGTWETVLGICNCCNLAEYDSINTEKFRDILDSVMLDDDILSMLTNKIFEIINLKKNGK